MGRKKGSKNKGPQQEPEKGLMVINRAVATTRRDNRVSRPIEIPESSGGQIPPYEPPPFPKTENLSIKVTSGIIKDMKCNYGYEISEGIGLGNKSNTTGIHVIKDDMKRAFVLFNVHMAFIDDVFKTSNVEVDDIAHVVGHDHTYNYSVTGFKIAGGEDNETIVLIGNKFVSVGGRINLVSPKIPIDNLSSYKWAKQLKEAADQARKEVSLYHGGKYEIFESEMDDDPQQMKMPFGEKADDIDDGDDEFANQIF